MLRFTFSRNPTFCFLWLPHYSNIPFYLTCPYSNIPEWEDLSCYNHYICRGHFLQQHSIYTQSASYLKNTTRISSQFLQVSQIYHHGSYTTLATKATSDSFSSRMFIPLPSVHSKYWGLANPSDQSSTGIWDRRFAKEFWQKKQELKHPFQCVSGWSVF